MDIYIFMVKILMIYKIPNADSIKRIQFNRKLFKYNMQINSGKRSVKTNGILSEFEKPIKSCVIFNKKYLEEVKELCKKYKIIYEMYQIKKI